MSSKGFLQFLLSAVLLAQSSAQTRVANTTLAMPDAPPPSNYYFENAFPGISFWDRRAIVLRSAPGDNDRLFVGMKDGVVKVLTTLNSPTSADFQDFLDIPTLLGPRPTEVFTDELELGLLGLAFHPDHQTNGYFYVVYDVEVNGTRYQRLSRFTASSTNINRADTSTELVLIQHRNRTTVHNGGDIHFGPDGYLYMSWGDEDYISSNTQNITNNFWSSVTRIDVDKLPGNPEPNASSNVPVDGMGKAYYSVPADNPAFSNGTSGLANVRTELWAIGLRNPWRMAFDSVTGRLFLGDVGDGDREEVNEITGGGNYGWPMREGLIAAGGSGPAPTGWTTLTDPFFDYDRDDGVSVIGGEVYRGGPILSLEGHYIFTDWIGSSVWAQDINNLTTAPEVIASSGQILAFGKHPATNDLLALDGVIRVLRESDATSPFPQTLSQTGVFSDLATLTPHPGIVPYNVNVPFWSDHADKRRWFSIPDLSGQVSYREDEPWTFPSGTVWVKHFDLNLTRGNPATAQRLETRLLVKNDDGIYGVSYRWNEAGTDATLVDPAGENFDLTIMEDGAPITQTWQIPSRANCATCHNADAGYALSFQTRQLNHTGTLSGVNGNFISLLSTAGYLDSTPPSHHVLPKFVDWDTPDTSLHDQARSFLAVNCAYCHMEDGLVPDGFSTEPHLGMSELDLIDGLVRQSQHPDDRLIVPGNHTRSVVLSRLSETNGYTRMPPIGSNQIDDLSAARITDWINNVLATRQTYDQWAAIELSGVAPNLRLKSANPDNDDLSNEEEFLLGTPPLIGSSANSMGLNGQINGNLFELTIPSLPGRSVLVEKTSDLINWERWNVMGNNGAEPAIMGPRTLSGSANDPKSFFRLLIKEN